MRDRLLRWPTLLLATVLHYIWGFTLLVDPRVVRVTDLIPVDAAGLNPRMVGGCLLVVAHIGAWALTRPSLSWKTLAALMPQQFVLFMSSSAATYYTVVGHYGDGVPRPHGFIFADQVLIILVTLLHTYVLAEAHRPLGGSRKEGRQ